MDSVLVEAARLVEGDRAERYGDARVMAERWAQMASAATGLPLCPEDLPKVMVCLKLARLRGEWHRDSWVDVAGYSRVAEMIEEGAGGLGCRPFRDQGAGSD